MNLTKKSLAASAVACLSALAFVGSAQATNTNLSQACQDTRDGYAVDGSVIPEFAAPADKKGTWQNQVTFIAASRGWDSSQSGITYLTSATQQGSDTANCRTIATYKNYFGIYDHVDIVGSIKFHYDSNPSLGYVPDAFWTVARTCTTDYPSTGTTFSCPL